MVGHRGGNGHYYELVVQDIYDKWNGFEPQYETTIVKLAAVAVEALVELRNLLEEERR
jgi:hypothetical protein